MIRKLKTGWKVLIAILLVIAGSLKTLALINPKFTPVHLVKQSALILELQLAPVKDGKLTATVRRVLKGKGDDKTVTFTLATSIFPEHIKTVEKVAEAKEGTQAIFFAGGFEGQGGGGGGAPDETRKQKGFLHAAGTWVSFSKTGDVWEMNQLADTMAGTWAGGADMLIRVADYVIADPDGAEVPVKEGVHWSNFKQIAKIDGAIHQALPVDLAGDGKLTLYIANENGDRLFKYDGKADMADVTASSKLTAKSKVSTWGDFNADGKMDLLSWDGAALTLFVQNADGTFQPGSPLLKGKLANDCIGLSCIDCGKPGHPGAVIATKTNPLLWKSDAPGSVTPIGGAFAGAELGTPGLCLVADLDGDAIPDILQMFEKGSLLYKGKAPGQFEDARPCAASLGTGTTSAFLGDYDADGLLDVFAVSSDSTSRLWSNRGKFEFADTMPMTGELSYKGQSGAIGGTTGDFNNDGRQDVVFFYANTSPHLYFNRGFRSFGMAGGLDLATHNLLPQAEEGAQAGCLADFKGDGAQDMIVVLKNGEVWAFYVEAEDEASRCVRAVLPSNGPYIGPLTVTGWRGNRCLGAWNVTAGTSEARFGQQEAGPMTLKWQMPGGKPQQKEVVVEDGPVRVVLTP